jgi:hypothetical protein
MSKGSKGVFEMDLLILSSEEVDLIEIVIFEHLPI